MPVGFSLRFRLKTLVSFLYCESVEVGFRGVFWNWFYFRYFVAGETSGLASKPRPRCRVGIFPHVNPPAPWEVSYFCAVSSAKNPNSRPQTWYSALSKSESQSCPKIMRLKMSWFIANTVVNYFCSNNDRLVLDCAIDYRTGRDLWCTYIVISVFCFVSYRRFHSSTGADAFRIGVPGKYIGLLCFFCVGIRVPARVYNSRSVVCKPVWDSDQCPRDTKQQQAGISYIGVEICRYVGAVPAGRWNVSWDWLLWPSTGHGSLAQIRRCLISCIPVGWRRPSVAFRYRERF